MLTDVVAMCVCAQRARICFRVNVYVFVCYSTFTTEILQAAVDVYDDCYSFIHSQTKFAQ